MPFSLIVGDRGKPSSHGHTHTQDDLLAELEEMEQEELEKGLLEVGEASNPIQTDPLDELPAVRKYLQLLE